jgi:hypothetical protein
MPHRTSTSEEQALPAAVLAATPSADFYSLPAILANSRPVTARAAPQTSHNASGVFTICVNNRAYRLKSSIFCGYPRYLTAKKRNSHTYIAEIPRLKLRIKTHLM